MAKNYYLSGQFNVTCDVCSKKIKASEAKHRWDGFITCQECWEPRQPLDFIRARVDKITVPFQRPIPTLEYIPQAFTEPLVDKVDIDDRYTRVAGFIRAYTDTVSFTDNGITARMDYGRSLSDSVSIAETFDTLIYTSLELSDGVTTTESIAKTVSIPKTDTLVIVDTPAKAVGVVKTDAITLVDLVVKVLTIAPTESLSIADTISFTQVANDAINASAINTQAIN